MNMVTIEGATLAEQTEPAQQVTVSAGVPAAATTGEVTSPFDRLIQAATDPNVDVEKMERMLAIAERWKAQEAKAAYANALAGMQPNLPDVRKRGDSGRYKYALWEDIQDSLRPVLARHGFSLSFRTAPTPGAVTVTAVLLHADGHSEATSLEVAFDKSGNKPDVQAMGSAVSYGKRYTCQALLNLTARGEDDDGYAAAHGAAPQTGEVVSAEQADQLRALVEDIDRTEAQFVAYANNKLRLAMETLDDLPVGALDATRKLLASAKAVMVKKAAANG